MAIEKESLMYLIRWPDIVGENIYTVRIVMADWNKPNRKDHWRSENLGGKLDWTQSKLWWIGEQARQRWPSAFKESSVSKILNRDPDTSITVAPSLWNVLASCRKYRKRGIVKIKSMGSTVILWSIKRPSFPMPSLLIWLAMLSATSGRSEVVCWVWSVGEAIELARGVSLFQVTRVDCNSSTPCDIAISLTSESKVTTNS